MSKTRIAVIVGGVVSLILVAITAWLTFSRMGKASEVRSSLDTARRQLASYYDRNPFPSEDNIGIEKVNLEKLRERYEYLLEQISTNAVSIKDEHSPGGFVTLCEETVQKLRNKAPKGEKDAPIAGADFYFGFDKYDRSKEGGGVLPDKGDVPRLVRQLKMMEMLINRLYESKVLKLEHFAREEFEAEDAAGSSSDTSRQIRRRKGSTRSSSGEGFAFSLDLDPLTQGDVPMVRESFSLVFNSKEAALFDFLNRIGGMWPYAQIAGVKIRKTGDDVVLLAEEKTAKAQTTEDPFKPTVKVPPKPRTSRLISGSLRESPVRVALQINIYTFEEPVTDDVGDGDFESGYSDQGW